MESSEDKHWAQRALIDPLNEPEPYEEDGPGTHFKPQSSRASLTRNRSSSAAAKLQKNNPFRQSSSSSKNPFVHETEVPRHDSAKAYPSPPPSASPRRERFSPKHESHGAHHGNPSVQQSKDGVSSSNQPLRRGNSLKERYPGDRSHRPLDQIKSDRKRAERAPHLRKHHQIKPDPIDKLDPVGGGFHHPGPFDATYYARNTSYTNSPLEAVAASNEEALKATPRDKILDAVHRHRPIDGVATYAPGETDPNGQTYSYESGENMMISGNPEGGAYKRWPGVQYHPDDIKGKGEPSYTIEKSFKDHKHSTSKSSKDGIEMADRTRPRAVSDAGSRKIPADLEDSSEKPQGRLSRGGNGGGSIRHRFGSIRKSLGGHAE